jgi:hypothetical protein
VLWGWKSALLLLVSLPVGARLFAGLRRDGPSQTRLLEFGITGCAALIVALAFVIPYMEVRKSFRPFFEDVRLHMQGRTLYTTQRNAYRTPLINYYMRQRVALSTGEADLRHLQGWARRRAVVEASAALLAGEEPVGVIMEPSECEELGSSLGRIPGFFVRSDLGRGILCFAGNRPGERS